MNKQEKLYDYQLVQYEFKVPRQYKNYKLTEEEAQAKNQAFALNRVLKRFVRTESRFN